MLTSYRASRVSAPKRAAMKRDDSIKLLLLADAAGPSRALAPNAADCTVAAEIIPPIMNECCPRRFHGHARNA